MTDRPWYTPSGAAARFLVYCVKKTAEHSDAMLAGTAMLYGLTDIYGIVQAVRIMHGLYLKGRKRNAKRK
jgi:hypothetical protein